MDNLQNVENTPAQYNKIGGWLILVVIGLILTPLRLLAIIVKDLLPMFSSETWSFLTTPGTEAYHPLWLPLVIFEIIGNIVFISFSIVAVIFLFQRRKFVPKLIIIFFLSNLAFILVDYFVADLIPFIANQEDPESFRELVRTFIGCSIWVPYFLVSKRVKGTFTV